MLVVGGRNDEACKSLNTPFLNDIHLFLLDQKAWVKVKYTPFSQRLYRLGNHTMCTMSDGETYEKTIIFGGITHSKLNSSKMNFGSSKKSKAIGSPTAGKVTVNKNLLNSRIEEGSEYTTPV